jgi:hypothetical protein
MTMTVAGPFEFFSLVVTQGSRIDTDSLPLLPRWHHLRDNIFGI